MEYIYKIERFKNDNRYAVYENKPDSMDILFLGEIQEVEAWLNLQDKALWV